MGEKVHQLLVAIVLAIMAYLKPIEGELLSLLLIFMLNFLFGYLSGMIANNEDFSFRKAFQCIGHAAVFFVLCAAIYVIGRAKGQMAGAVQCVSVITYLVLYFYGLNILRNLRKTFKPQTPPWHVVSFLYYVLRFKFIEKIPYLADYLNMRETRSEKNCDLDSGKM